MAIYEYDLFVFVFCLWLIFPLQGPDWFFNVCFTPYVKLVKRATEEGGGGGVEL